MTGQRWTLDDGRVIALLTPDEFAKVDPGAVLLTIMGRRVVVGRDAIDTDTRVGHLGFGPIIEDRTYEQRVTKLAEDVVRSAPPLIVRVLSDEGEGALAVAMRRLISCVTETKDQDA